MKHLIRTFGRIHGKKLSKRQADLVATLLPKLLPGALPSGIRILEIGFGAGEHMVHLLQNPDFYVVGAEPFMNGVASLLSKIEGSPALNRLAVWPGDVREYMGNNSDKFDLIYILHPDPWPKAKHEKRRLLSREFLAALSGILSPGGLIVLGTDHRSYFEWARSEIEASNFMILNKDENFAPALGLSTRYCVKNKFGSERPFYFVLLRRGDDLPSPERLARLDLTLA
ncbi:MAG: hypothetical protein LBG89_00055 [Rickettsiales bacterium]|jgi:tRNA (guanine-N7-)-methyltransferase|nr:hypothetical protein [Rickettsiales bacterium]